MPEKENQNKVVFFLGAGASIEAGIPGTYKFIYGIKEEGGIEGFLEWLKEENKETELKILKTILDTFQLRIDHPVIDVELVLGTLNALNNKEKHDLVYFYDKKSFKFKSEDETKALKILESDLKEFIRRKVVANKEEISYLKPLIEFKPIDVFSVNYDTCIEMLCLKHKLTYTDGFELYWNPELFEKERDIKLFKLHGSIMWYSTDYGNYVKLPLKMDGKKNDISLITEETAEPFIMYPMGRKLDYLEPVGYLINKLQNSLKSKNTELCIVVGYSFRDDDIKRIFFESAKENENLTIILIDPNAGKTFNKILRYRDNEKSIESPIADRVICFNYPFGSVLKNNYLYRVKNGIPRISNWYSQFKNEKRVGNIEYFTKNAKTCVEVAIEAQHVYFIEKIFETELGISPPENWGFYNEEEKARFRLSYSLAIFYLLNSDEKGKKYFEILRDNLKDILYTGKQYFDLNIELSEAKTEEAKIEIKRKIDDLQKQHPYSNFYYWSARSGDLGNAIQSFYDLTQSQLKLNPNDDFKLLRSAADGCLILLDIFNNQYDEGKYKGSDKISIAGISVEKPRKIDLENGLDNLIKKIEQFIEYYEHEAKKNEII